MGEGGGSGSEARLSMRRKEGTFRIVIGAREVISDLKSSRCGPTPEKEKKRRGDGENSRERERERG